MRNEYEVRGDVTAIFMTHKGKQHEAIIDTEDLPLLNKYDLKWGIQSPKSSELKYARINVYDSETKKSTTVRLHHVICPLTEGMVVDHINHNSLDNRKCNLRNITTQGNIQNLSGPRVDSKSGIRGVSWHKSNKKWRAVVRVNGKHKVVGYFKSIEDAEKAAIAARAEYYAYATG